MTEHSDCLTKGLQAFKEKEFETAVIELEQATFDNTDDYSAFLYLGAAYASVGRINAAIGALKKAEELKPDDPKVHYNLGQAYEAAGVPKEAFVEYARALRISPCYSYARNAFTSLKSRMSGQHSDGMRMAA